MKLFRMFIGSKADTAQLTKNYFYMLINQLLINITPLIILPFLLPIINEENYAYIIVTAGISSFFLIIFDYGMNLYGTKKIAESDNSNFRQVLYLNITLLKFFLGVFGIGVFFLINYFANNLESVNFLLFYYLAIVMQGLIPLWYFQGIERFQIITLINLLSKVVFIILLILLINEEQKWTLYSLALCAGNGISLLGSFIIIQRISPINIKKINFNIILLIFKKGFGYFNFNLLSTIYISSSTIIMSSLGFDKVLIAQFGISEKIVRGIRQIFNPVTKVVYPYLTKLKKVSNDNYKRKFHSIILLLTVSSIIIILLLHQISEYILHFIGVSDVVYVKYLVVFLSPLILFGSLSNILITSGLIVNEMISKSNFLIILATVVFLGFVLVPDQKVDTFIYAILLAELILIIGSIIFLYYEKSK